MSTELHAPEVGATPNEPMAPVSSNGKVPIPPRNPELMKDIRALLRERVAESGEAQPRQVVEVVLRELIQTKRYDLLMEAAREGLLELAWHDIRSDAAHGPAQRSPNVSGKWDAVAQAVENHRDIFEARVYTGAEVKFLGDCTKADLTNGAEFKSKQANTMLDNAERMKKLARKLKADQVVRDLGREVVEGVFNA